MIWLDSGGQRSTSHLVHVCGGKGIHVDTKALKFMFYFFSGLHRCFCLLWRRHLFMYNVQLLSAVSHRRVAGCTGCCSVIYSRLAIRVTVTAVSTLPKTRCSRCRVVRLQLWWAAAADDWSHMAVSMRLEQCCTIFSLERKLTSPLLKLMLH